MKLSVILTLAVMMMFGVAIAEANMLSNAGFESGNLNGWDTWNTSSSTIVTSPVHSGTYAVNATLNSSQTEGCLQQNLWGTLTYGDSIYSNVWVRSDALAGQQALLKIEFRGSGWENYGDIASTPISGTNDWTLLSISGTVPTAAAAPNLDKISVMMRLNGAKTAGDVYFDDAYADSTPIPEPTSMLLLGSGLLGLFAFNRKK